MWPCPTLRKPRCCQLCNGRSTDESPLEYPTDEIFPEVEGRLPWRSYEKAKEEDSGETVRVPSGRLCLICFNVYRALGLHKEHKSVDDYYKHVSKKANQNDHRGFLASRKAWEAWDSQQYGDYDSTKEVIERLWGRDVKGIWIHAGKKGVYDYEEYQDSALQESELVHDSRTGLDEGLARKRKAALEQINQGSLQRDKMAVESKGSELSLEGVLDALRQGGYQPSSPKSNLADRNSLAQEVVMPKGRRRHHQQALGSRAARTVETHCLQMGEPKGALRNLQDKVVELKSKLAKVRVDDAVPEPDAHSQATFKQSCADRIAEVKSIGRQAREHSKRMDKSSNRDLFDNELKDLDSLEAAALAFQNLFTAVSSPTSSPESVVTSVEESSKHLELLGVESLGTCYTLRLALAKAAQNCLYSEYD
ncbi:Uncharacterized protein SCF082_LOCUS51789, partial [Durusdinium trenchii]